MAANLVLTLTGPDRIGIVDELTGLLLERGGNVETSRMARLGGEFAVLMLVTLPDDAAAQVESVLGRLTSQGYKLTLTPSASSYTAAHPGWSSFRIEVQGADHEGIIHEVAHYLSERGISIEAMDSQCAPGPTSGVPLFAMEAQVVVPPQLAQTDWQAGLAQVGQRLNLEISVASQTSA